MYHVLQLALEHDQDVVTARQRAAHLAQALGFDGSEQTRMATAVSEIVRNAFRYAAGGTVGFAIDDESRPQRLVVRVADRGRGIPKLEDVLSGHYRSDSGLGIGITGARRLMDRFSIESSPDGTTVVLEKFLPPRAGLLTRERLQQVAETITSREPAGLVEEVQRQNQELLRALDELQRKQQELLHVNRELEDTNRGVVALYAELDEKADHLRRADELKSRFLSNMTHEFRTPLNSIIGLTRLMLDDRQRAGVEAEQEVLYIRDAAEQLTELVNDLLDLAKVEAGKTVVRPADCSVDAMFGALRGMLRPLLAGNQSIALVFESGEGLPPLYTDEGKLAQILRNLVSNGLKFTERGEVRVSARLDDAGDWIRFEVSDTGIGIRPEDCDRIFEEFTQLEHRLQRRARGTGLGLPLSRRLAELLGGTLTVRSEVGAGSTFSVRIPVHYHEPVGERMEWLPEPGKTPILVIEDAADAQYFYQKALASSPFQIYPAHTLREADWALQSIHPAIVILDVMIGQEEGWDVLLRIKRDDRLGTVPVIVISSLSEREKAAALGADLYLPKPIDRRLLLETLESIRSRMTPIRVLAVHGDEGLRPVVRHALTGPAFALREALSAEDGVEMAQADPPDAILLDLSGTAGDGDALLAELARDERTRAVPVLIIAPAAAAAEARQRPSGGVAVVLPGPDLSRDTLAGAVRALLGGGDRRDAGAPASRL